MAKETAESTVKNFLDGAVGAGLALVVLPCVALYFGIPGIGAMPVVGLPLLAIFGIMILFGALALVSTLFARLGLTDPNQALALPEGSVRAAIALALIVLFAIISIMLYESTSKPYVITGLGAADKAAVIKDAGNRLIAVVPERCAVAPAAAGATATGAGNPAGTAECAPENLRFSVHLQQPPAQESTDLAKQLLILIGTLMTSVTSFYFASRATEPKRTDDPPASTRGGPANSLQSPQSTLAAGQSGNENNLDGCDVPIGSATPDEELPASRGGVA